MSLKAVMLDLSGTVHVGENLLVGAQEAISKLKSNEIPIKYVTNSSKESKEALLRKLRRTGLEVNSDEVFTALSAARMFVSSQSLRPMLLLEKEALNEFAGIETEAPNSVVIGLAPAELCYRRINEAFNIIKSGGTLVACNKSRYFKREEGLAIGAGAFVTALEFATDTSALVVGKPELEFFNLALKGFGTDLRANEVLMVGDDIRDDVLGAQAAGLKGGLVRTGKYQTGDETRYGAPNFVFDNLEEMADMVINQNVPV